MADLPHGPDRGQYRRLRESLISDSATGVDGDHLSYEGLEALVDGKIGDVDREIAEVHLEVCAQCADELAGLRELRDAPVGMVRSGPAVVVRTARWTPRRWVPLAAAAGVILAAGLTIWFRESSAPTPESTVASTPAPQRAAPTTTTPAPPPPAPAPGKLSASKPIVALAVLAHVDAPLYLPVTLRGQPDEAVKWFEKGMERYLVQDFAGAIPDLETAVRLDADAPPANFFLAICRLLTGDVAPAVEGLEKTIALGKPEYLEEAHFYLAKARLRQGRLTEARDELARTIARHGRLEREARTLLIEVNKHIEGTGR